MIMKKSLPRHLSQLGLALFAPLALMLALILLMPQPAYAAGTVTVCDESNLRAVLVDGGLVDFSCGPAMVNLSAPLVITKNTTIDGGGLITLLGDGTFRIFDVTDDSGPDFELKLIGLTVSGGYAASTGGAIVVNNGNTVTVVNSTLSNNVAQGRGGAVYAELATVNITNSTIISNVAGGLGGAQGGAIYARSATVNIINSAVISNAVSEHSNGGGMYVFDTNLTLVNSTLSNNNTSAEGGGAFLNTSPVFITNTTIFSNSAEYGGGLREFNSNVSLKNTIIAGNVASNSRPDCYGTFTSQGHNLIGDTSGCTIVPDPTTITGQDPLLGPLTDNGGSTPTHALLPGSPAINAGDNAACAVAPVNGVDQRGVARPQGTTCDIGAFEATANLTVAKTAVNEGGDPLRPGERITYTITITNSGSLTSTGATVSDTFPINTSFVPGSINITPAAAGGAAGTQPILANGITVAADSTVTVTYVVTVSKPLPDGTIITNTASVTSTEAPTPTPDKTDTVTSTVAAPNLTIDKETSTPIVTAGDVATYSVVIRNTGTALATGVVVTDTLPLGFSYRATSAIFESPGLVTRPSTNNPPTASTEPVWSDWEIAPNGILALTFTVDVSTSVSNGTYYNHARTGSNETNEVDDESEVEVRSDNPESSTIYLPLILKNPVSSGPDLIVDHIIATSDGVQVVIKNDGSEPVPVNFDNEFWVDIYVNPVPPPTGVNQTCESGDISCSHYAVWGITQALLPQLIPQGVITLTVGDVNQDHGDFSISLAPGTPVYAQVDSDNALTTYGAVQETNENNNINSTLSVAGLSGFTVETPADRERLPTSIHLPPRSSK